MVEASVVAPAATAALKASEAAAVMAAVAEEERGMAAANWTTVPRGRR